MKVFLAGGAIGVIMGPAWRGASWFARDVWFHYKVVKHMERRGWRP